MIPTPKQPFKRYRYFRLYGASKRVAVWESFIPEVIKPFLRQVKRLLI